MFEIAVLCLRLAGSRNEGLMSCFRFFQEQQKSRAQSGEAGVVKVPKSASVPSLNCHSGLLQFTTQHYKWHPPSKETGLAWKKKKKSLNFSKS